MHAMGRWLTGPRWSPYVVGVGIGMLSWLTFGLMGHALGTSTSFVTCAAAVEGIVAPQHVQQTPYLAGQVVGRPVFNWQVMLVISLFVGAWIARRISTPRGEKPFVEHVPRLWQWRFGPSKLLRYSVAFVAGLVLIFGARLADGCTSGHAVSGGLQLAVSSWAFLMSMFIVGIASAFVIFGKEGRHHV